VKVAILSTRFQSGPGGVERHLAEIVPRIHARGYEVEVFTTDLYSEFPWKKLPPDAPRTVTTDWGVIHRLPVWSMPGELHYPFFVGLSRALEEFRPDILHGHTYGTNHVARAARYHRRHGTPFVLTAHFHPIWSIEGGWMRHRVRSFYDRRLAAGVLSDVSRLVVQGQEELRLLRSLNIALPPVSVIPPGYSPLPAPPPGGPSFGERHGIPGPYVLFVGRLASNKGLRELLGAFTILHHRHPEAHLAIVGEEGGVGAEIRARAKEEQLEPFVHLLGRLPDDRDLATAYRDARLLALPSEYEAFGLVLLEALAQGCPVVASRIGGIPEFIPDGKAGLLVPPKSVPELAAALERLWSDPAFAKELARYGREEVVPRFSWDALADRLDTVYREVTAR
jgi:glycosyltransferase involved in cell wall biosynthesis